MIPGLLEGFLEIISITLEPVLRTPVTGLDPKPSILIPCNYQYLCFIDEETKTHRHEVTCPRSDSLYVSKSGIEPKSYPQVPNFTMH